MKYLKKFEFNYWEVEKNGLTDEVVSDIQDLLLGIIEKYNVKCISTDLESQEYYRKMYFYSEEISYYTLEPNKYKSGKIYSISFEIKWSQFIENVEDFEKDLLLFVKNIKDRYHISHEHNLNLYRGQGDIKTYSFRVDGIKQEPTNELFHFGLESEERDNIQDLFLATKEEFDIVEIDEYYDLEPHKVKGKPTIYYQIKERNMLGTKSFIFKIMWARFIDDDKPSRHYSTNKFELKLKEFIKKLKYYYKTNNEDNPDFDFDAHDIVIEYSIRMYDRNEINES